MKRETNQRSPLVFNSKGNYDAFWWVYSIMSV